ncbi:MAG: 2-phospho-L-lactate guanylyltransferase [Steroidobacteraceae bacterium]|nr:2-phospho-L-lactate guanylyltransferase [Steroidobacteraceae bacterium]
MAEQACVAIIAVNERRRCKTRLDGLLGPDGRVELARAMLDRVLAAVRAVPGLDAVLVVSPERDRVPDCIPVLHDSGDDLNAAMDAGRREAVARGARELLALPADLPLLRPVDVVRLLAAGRRSGVAIAMDRRCLGTNGLYLPAGMPFGFRFGAGSCARHEAEATRLGLGVRRVRSPGLLADLDTAEDLPDILARPRVGERLPFAVAAS